VRRTTPAAHVEIAIADGSSTYTTYSATNGNFWFPAPCSIDWASAHAHLRKANGERQMPGTPAAGCNSCHAGADVLTAP
jgi:hypothetical protein